MTYNEFIVWRKIMNIEMNKYKAIAYIGVVIIAASIAKMMMPVVSSMPIA